MSKILERIRCFYHWAVAHRKEQRAYISLAVGSIPTRPTKRHQYQAHTSQFRCGVGVVATRQFVGLKSWVQFPYITPKLIFRDRNSNPN